jgi:ankyrin repeat protein
MKYLKTYNESLRDKMTPKSDEEILKELGDLTPDDMLFQSSKYNFLKGVKKALEMGADINYKNKINNTSLIMSSGKGYKNVVELLLKNDADVNIRNIGGFSALNLASKKGYKEIVELLKKYGAKK